MVKSGLVEATLNGIAHRAGAGSLFYVQHPIKASEGMMRGSKGPCSYQVIKVVSEKTPQKT